MSDLKISQLQELFNPYVSDVIPIVHQGITKKASIETVSKVLSSALYAQVSAFSSTNYQTASANWENTYNTVVSNSAQWANDADDSAVNTLVQSNSAIWNTAGDYQGTDIKDLSSNWQSTYNTFNAISSTFLTSETDSQTLSFDELNNNLSISNGNVVSLSSLVDGTAVDTSVRALTSNWVGGNDAFTNLVSNSAAYLSSVDLSFLSVSGNWNSCYTTVQSNSATTWIYQGTDLKELSANWQTTYNTVSALSGYWTQFQPNPDYPADAQANADLEGDIAVKESKPYGTIYNLGGWGDPAGGQALVYDSTNTFDVTNPFQGTSLANRWALISDDGDGGYEAIDIAYQEGGAYPWSVAYENGLGISKAQAARLIGAPLATTASEGTSIFASRADHVHPLPAEANSWNSVYTSFSSNSASYLKTSTASVIIAQAGDDLIAKYAEAVALIPNLSASTTNRASLIIFPAEYSTDEEPVFDAEFVDVIALGSSEKKPSVFIKDSSVNVTANDVRVVGISTKGQPFKVSGGPLQVFENCSGGNNSFGHSADGSYLGLNGTFINCTAGNKSFGHMIGNDDTNIAGTFINCTAGDRSFGYSTGNGSLEAFGKFENCTAGDYSFMGGETSSKYINCTAGNNCFGNLCKGTYTDCAAGNFSFSQQDGIASGTFTNCVAGNYSFASNTGNASGTFTGCKGLSGCFGGNGGYASGTFIDCVAGPDSFGGAYIEPSGPHSFPIAEAKGTFTNCVGGSNCFAGNGGTASGTFTNCIGGIDSFGGEGTLSGKLFYCRLTAGSYETPSGAGVIRLCIDGSNVTVNAG